MSGRAAFVERLGVPLRWWVQTVMLIATFWLAMIVAMPLALANAIAGVLLLLAAAALFTYGRARVRVDDEWFEAGRARIPARFLGPAIALDPEQTRRRAGRDADVRAYLLLRGYVKRAVEVPITDPRDSTPYWLISSRRPDLLAKRLNALSQSAAPESTAGQ